MVCVSVIAQNDIIVTYGILFGGMHPAANQQLFFSHFLLMSDAA